MLAVGTVAAVDLRKLQTPGGTAVRWAAAAVFGVCGDYLKFSVSDPSVTDSRTRAQLCRDLDAASADARNNVVKTDLVLGHVIRHGSSARVQMVLTRDDSPTSVTLQLRQVQGQWRVVRNSLTCGSLGCP